MMELLHDTHIWVAFSFFAFLLLVWIKARKNIIGGMDARIETIRQEIQTAENLKKEAAALLADYERKQAETIAEAKNIVKNAEKNAAEIRHQAEVNLEESMQRREKQLQSRLDNMKQSAVNEIQQYAADLAIKATQEIIAQKLDQKAGNKLLDDSIKNISSKIH